MNLLSTNIAGVELPCCVMNASGPNDQTFDELHIIAQSDSGAIVTKSCTIEPREGNPEPRYKAAPLGSINSMGLPNHGFVATADYVQRLRAHTSKPIIASVAGLSPEDFPTLVRAMQDCDADLIEVNLSCPNVPGKPQIAYDFDAMDTILSSIASLGAHPIGVKLPPYFDPVHFEAAARVLAKHPVRFITCINSIGNALIIDPDTETAIIKPKGGFGGLGGAYVKPTGLANVRAFRQLLGEEIGIVGVGGISTGTDAFEYILAGADAVQLGTCFAEEGAGCFARINAELSAVLQRKGYENAHAARGKLRILA